MSVTLLLHIAGEDNIVVDIDEMPDPKDQVLICSNPRLLGGKEVGNILPEVNRIIFPWWRINFVEVLPGQEEDEIYGFYRE